MSTDLARLRQRLSKRNWLRVVGFIPDIPGVDEDTPVVPGSLVKVVRVDDKGRQGVRVVFDTLDGKRGTAPLKNRQGRCNFDLR